MTSTILVLPPTFEHHHDGFGVGHRRPRLSWKFRYVSDVNEPATEFKPWIQRAYDVEIQRQVPLSTRQYAVESSESSLVPWPGDDLCSREISQVRVRCYGIGRDEPTLWSPWAVVEASLLQKDDWSAIPITIGHKLEERDTGLHPIRFRKTFQILAQQIRKVRIYATCYGVYEVYIDGNKIGDHALAPGWTSYNHRIAVQTLDIDTLLSPGEHVISAEVAEGWYAGKMGVRGGQRFNYGTEIALMLQLEVCFDTGESLIIPTDRTWKSHLSAIVASEIYNGETYDVRQEQKGWQTPNFEDSKWVKVKPLSVPSASMLPLDMAPMRVTKTVIPTNQFKSPSGKLIVDFGHNIVGVVSLGRVPPHAQVSLIHAEVLVDGELGRRPLGGAKCTDTVITSDQELLDWRPKFTYRGFRYLQIDGWPEETIDVGNLKALIIHTDMQRRGWFRCSNDMVNTLHENIIRSMQGNFLSVPTDCPQRDERLGWTGDIQVFAPVANFLYDTAGILSNWLQDLSAEQMANDKRIPPLVCPDVMGSFWTPTPQAIWHDVTILLPWTLYHFYGDREILVRQYPSMLAWIDRAIRRGPDGLWDEGLWQLGDWVDPHAPPSEPGNGRTDGTLVADAYLVHVTFVLAQIARIVGDYAAYLRFTDNATRLKGMFEIKYITRHGNLMGDTQASLALAVYFGLYSQPKHVEVAKKRLIRLICKARCRVSTGFAGTPVILPALSKLSLSNLAYRMLLEQHCPSWLYPVTVGATTVWERWDALQPDGSLNPGRMLSFNHYAFGSVASWIHDTLGGIGSRNGWKTVVVKPVPGGGITRATTEFLSPYGYVCCSWEAVEGAFKMRLEIPPNSSADIELPGQVKVLSVGSGTHNFEATFEPEQWPPSTALASYRGPGLEPCSCPYN